MLIDPEFVSFWSEADMNIRGPILPAILVPMKAMKRRVRSGMVRNFVFGVEDSLVSNIGLVTGITAAGQTSAQIIVTCMVVILVESFSIGVAALLSDNSVQEFETGTSISLLESLLDALVIFISFLISGSFIIIPFMFFEAQNALSISIGIALAALFVLGIVNGRLSRGNVIRKGFTMLLVGGATIALGALVGNFFSRT